MADLRNIVTERLERLREDIVASIESHGITASGRTQRSLHVEQDGDSVQLVADAGNRAPIATLEVGRPGGKVPGRFYLILAQWSRDKGIPFRTERERNTFAYFLGKKIEHRGTDRNYNPVDTYSSLVTAAVEDIGSLLMAEITERIERHF